ncbi:MAG: sodium:proton antiporter, partial [Ignavibacteria bacterium]|nr:sodium:proton antiporter [Ignavibacteria bacterium]
IISNVGGALTPIGDPPLFLGFLRGVPFFWVIENVFPIWIIGILLTLLIFFLFDISNKKETEVIIEKGKHLVELKGSKNLAYFAIIIIAVFIDPKVMSWVPSLSPLPFGIREIIMFSVAIASFKTAELEILKANEFDFEPIKEVAYLFVGIFLTMIPALQLIAYESRVYSHYLTQATFYWSTGALSSVLDNAPTYLNFLSAAMGKFGLDINLASDVKHFVTVDEVYLRAISVGAVFFGAMTYIGNGPNFMVKSISERAGIEMPSFFTYIVKYSLPILLPIFALIWFLFFRG